MMNFEGSWELKDGEGEVRASLEIVVSEGPSWRLSAKVGNRMNCQLRLEEGRLRAGPVMSTRLMPPPDLLELENKVSHLLSNLTDIHRNGDILKIEAGEKS